MEESYRQQLAVSSGMGGGNGSRGMSGGGRLHTPPRHHSLQANMRESPHGSFNGSDHVVCLRNLSVTAERSGQLSAAVDIAAVDIAAILLPKHSFNAPILNTITSESAFAGTICS